MQERCKNMYISANGRYDPQRRRAAFPMNCHFICIMLAIASSDLAQGEISQWKFSFDGTPTKTGFVAVSSDGLYNKSKGYGFEAGGGGIGQAFYFSVALPEGNYNVDL